MRTRSFSTTFAWLILALLLFVIIGVTAWANIKWVDYLPSESEFFYKWQITRGLIFNNINPYDNVGGYQFISPLPVLILYFPFALIENYEIARAAWITAIQVCAMVFAILCIRNTSWRLNRWMAVFFVIFALFWFPVVSIYVRGSETIFMAVFFTAALFTIQNEQAEIAGILLAFSALQPRVTLIGVLLLLIWTGSQRKWLLYFWGGVTFLIVSAMGMIFLPSWPLDFMRAIYQNVDISVGKTIIETTTRWWPGVGQQIGWGMIILATIALVIEWWLVWGKRQKQILWTTAFTWVIAIWIGVETNIDNVALLLLSLTVIFSAWSRRWGRSGQVFNFGIMLLLLPGLWWAYIFFQQNQIGESSNPILMIGFPLLVLVGLYWVRWWFLQAEYLNLGET